MSGAPFVHCPVVTPRVLLGQEVYGARSYMRVLCLFSNRILVGLFSRRHPVPAPLRPDRSLAKSGGERQRPGDAVPRRHGGREAAVNEAPRSSGDPARAEREAETARPKQVPGGGLLGALPELRLPLPALGCA